MRVELKLLLLLLFGSVSSVPLSLDGSECARKCSTDPQFVRFTPQQTFVYRIESETRLLTAESVRFSASAQIAVHSQCEVTLVLRDVHVTGVSDPFPLKQQLEAQSLQFGYDDGRIVGVCSSPDDDPFAVNVKKAIISALQMSARSTMVESEVRETDVLGNCDTQYTPLTRRYSTVVMRKWKSLADCESRGTTRTSVWPRPFGIQKTLPLLNVTYECEQTLDKDLVIESKCSERQMAFNRLQVTSSMNVKFVKQIAGLTSKRLSQFNSHSLLMMTSPQHAPTDELTLNQLLRRTCDAPIQELTQLMTPIVDSIRGLSFASLQRVHQTLPCDKSGDILVDSAARASTESAMKLLATLKQNGKISDLKMDFLLTQIMFNNEPRESLIRPLIPLLTKSRTSLLAISSLVHNWCETTRDCHETTTLTTVVSEIEKRIPLKSSIDTIAAIRALQNIGSVRSRDVLLRQSSQGDDSVRIAAIEALKDIVDDRVRQQLLRVLSSESEATDVRIAAYKTLISAVENVKQIESIVQRTRDEELRSYVVSHARELSRTHDPHRKRIPELSLEDSGLGKSRYYGYSHVNDNYGIIVDSDVIYGHTASSLKSFSFNLTLPLYGRSLQLISINVRVPKQQLTVMIDGKTMIVADSRDAQHLDLWRKIRDALSNGERAFVLPLIDTHVTFPTLNGFPMTLTVNGTALGSVQMDSVMKEGIVRLKMAPQIAVELSAAMSVQFHHQSHAMVRVAARASAAPHVDFSGELRESRLVNAKLNVPEQQTLLAFATESLIRHPNGRVVQLIGQSSQPKQYKHCTNQFDRPLGVSLCTELVTPRHGYAPMSGAVTLVKTDAPMKGFELSLERPSPASSRDMRVWRVALNTPQSRINRQWIAEVSVASPSMENGQLRVTLQSPFRSMSTLWTLNFGDRERSLIMETTVDGQRKAAFDIGLETESRGRKMELRPRVRITYDQQPVVNLQGSVSVTKGRKNQIQIDLHDARASKRFIKGSVVKESSGNEFRVSTDVSIALNQFDSRIYGVCDHSARHSAIDWTIEYQRKQSIKLSAKVQNLSSGQLTKVSAFTDLQSTQWPRLNTHVQYTLLHKPREHFENELKVERRDNWRIHLLQVSTVKDSRFENSLVTEATPFDWNYETRVNAHVRRDNQPEYSLEVTGKDRSGRTGRDARGLFVYRQVSRAPLKLTMDATVKLFKQNEWKYSDSLQQVTDNEFTGKTEITGNGKRLFSVDYRYAMRADGHEFDADVITARGTRYPTHGLLRMSRDGFEAKAKLNNYAVETLVARPAIGKFLVDTPMGRARIDRDGPIANWEVQARDVIHKTSVDAQQWKLKSETRQSDSTPLLIVDATVPSSLIVQHEMVEARASATPDLWKVDVRHPQDKWTHVTSVGDGGQWKSKTVSGGRILLDTDGQLSPSVVVNVQSPHYGQSLSFVKSTRRTGTLELESNRYAHKTQYDLENPKLKSLTSLNGRRLVDVEYTGTKQRHHVTLDSDPIRMTALVEPKLKQFDLKTVHVTHTTQLLQPHVQQYQLMSKTQSGGKLWAQIDAKYAPKQSHVQLKSGTTMEARVDLTPEQLKWNVQIPQLDHAVHVQRKQWTMNGHVNQWKSDARLSRENTFLNVDGPQLNGHVRITPQLKQLKFRSEPYSHVTTLEPGFVLKSQTEHSREGPLLSIDANRKQLTVEYGPRNTYAHISVDPVFVVKARDNNQWTHESSYERTPNEEQWIRSKTETANGRTLLNVNAQLTKLSTGQVSVDTPRGSVSGEYDGNSLQWQVKTDPYTHRTLVTRERIESQTDRNGQQIMALNGKYAANSKSFDLDTPYGQALWSCDPNQQHTVQLKSATIDHRTVVSPANIESRTEYNRRLMMSLDARVGGRGQLKTPAFDVDWDPSEGAKWDVRTAVRHVTGQINVVNPRAELAWDVDRDPSARARVQWRNNRLEGAYRNTEFTASGQMNGRDYWRGPHRFDAELRDGTSVTTFEAKHEIAPKEWNCNVRVKRDGKRLFETTAHVARDTYSMNVHAPRLTLAAVHKPQMKTDLRGMIGEQTFSFVGTHDGQMLMSEAEMSGLGRGMFRYDPMGEVMTSLYDMRGQRSMELNAKLRDNQFSADLWSRRTPQMKLNVANGNAMIVYGQWKASVELNNNGQQMKGHWESPRTATYDVTGKYIRTSGLEMGVTVEKDSAELFRSELTSSSGTGDVSVAVWGKPYATGDWLIENSGLIRVNGRFAGFADPVTVKWSRDNSASHVGELCAQRECTVIALKGKRSSSELYGEGSVKRGDSQLFYVIVEHNRNGNGKFQVKVRDAYEFGSKWSQQRASVDYRQDTARASIDAEWSRDSLRVSVVPIDSQRQLTLNAERRNNNDYSLELTSPQWTRPQRIQLQRPSSRQLKSQIQLNGIHASLDLHYGQRNNSVTVAVRDDQNTVDVYGTAHASLTSRQDWSVGGQWRNKNRNGQLQSGYYLLKGGDRRWELWRYDPIDEWHWTGQYTHNSDGTVSAEFQTEQNRINMKTRDKCVEMTVKRQQQLQQKFSACIDGRVLSASMDSYGNGDQITDASLRVERTGPKTVRAHANWDPQSVGEFLYKLANDNGGDAMEELGAETQHKWRQLSRQIAPLIRQMNESLRSLMKLLNTEYYGKMYNNYERKSRDYVQRIEVPQFMRKYVTKISAIFNEILDHYSRQLQRTQRVLLYDPQRGELIVEWNAPKQLWKPIDQWWQKQNAPQQLVWSANHVIFANGTVTRSTGMSLVHSDVTIVRIESAKRIRINDDNFHVSIDGELRVTRGDEPIPLLNDSNGRFEMIGTQTLHVQSRRVSLVYTPKRETIEIRSFPSETTILIDDHQQQSSVRFESECRRFFPNHRQLREHCSRAVSLEQICSLTASNRTKRSPDECLQCSDGSGTTTEFGARITTNTTSRMDIVVAIDGTCRWPETTLTAILNSFNNNSAFFIVVGDRPVHAHPLQWPLSPHNSIIGRVVSSDRRTSMDTFSVPIPFRFGASKHYLLLMCDACAHASRIDYSTALHHVTATDAHVHIVQQGGRRKDECSTLARATGGTVRRFRPRRTLSGSGVKWRHRLARDIIAGHVTGACQRCDCIVDGDRVTSLMRCGACNVRPLIDDAEQQWTEDDDDE